MLYRLLFLLGITVYLFGQILLAQGNDFVYSLRPIDFAHWSLFLGVLLMIPQVVNFPRSVFSAVGIPLTLVGIACILGMCVLDFIWWSMPNEDARIEFTNHIANVPSIWQPFIKVGPSSKLFNVGLFLLGLNYWKHSKWPVMLLFVATLLLMGVIPFWYRLVSGYTLTLVAFGWLFYREWSIQDGSAR